MSGPLRKQTAGIFVDAFGLKTHGKIPQDQRFDFQKFLVEHVGKRYTPMCRNVYLSDTNKSTDMFVSMIESYTYDVQVHRHWQTLMIHDMTIMVPGCEVVFLACMAPGLEPLIRMYAERGTKFYFVGIFAESYLALPGSEVLKVDDFLRPARKPRAVKA